MSEQTTEGVVGLIAEWQADLQAGYIDEPTVTDVRIGVFYTAVEISTGDIGVAFTPRDLSGTVCCPKTAAGAPPAGRLIGIGAWEMTRYALAPSPLRRDAWRRGAECAVGRRHQSVRTAGGPVPRGP